MEAILQSNDGNPVLDEGASYDSCLLSVLGFFAAQDIWGLESGISENFPYRIFPEPWSCNGGYTDLLPDRIADQTFCKSGTIIIDVCASACIRAFVGCSVYKNVHLYLSSTFCSFTIGLMKKISTRSDRFVVGETIHISEGLNKVKERINNYQGVVICDIASQERNAVLKYCYGRGIRSYTTPKISDLIIRSAESQHINVS